MCVNLKLKASKPSCTTKSSAVTKQPVGTPWNSFNAQRGF